ncbi:MAG TPA: DUF3576 domain-containing protein [Burkholderiales bacterium]
MKALLWIPALWALAFDWYAGPFSFTPSYLSIPLAALLGLRYGPRALWLVALGGLPLLPPLASFGVVALTSAPDVYVVALAVCALAADERPLAERVPPRIGLALFAAVLVVLPLVGSIWGAEVGALKIRMTFGFVAIFWLVLFLVGWSGFPARRAVAGLAIAAALGMWVDATLPRDGGPFFGGPLVQLPFLGLTGTDHLWWDYRLDSTAAFLAGVAYFVAGRLWAEMLRTRAAPLSPRRAYALVLMVAALALGYTVNRAALAALGFELHPLSRYGFVIGAPLALPVTGLLGGLLLGGRGLAVAVLAVPAFWVLDAFAMSGFGLPLRAFSAPLHQPLCVLAFGLIGVAMRERALDPEARRAPSGWFWLAPDWARGAGYAACVLLALSALFAGAAALYSHEPGRPAGNDAKLVPNPLLWQAARETAAQYPLVEADAVHGRLVTGWRSDPGSPEARTRMTIRVGAELVASALHVELVRETRGRFGLWVQQGVYVDARTGKLAGTDIAPERERMRSRVFARALELKKSGSEPR